MTARLGSIALRAALVACLAVSITACAGGPGRGAGGDVGPRGGLGAPAPRAQLPAPPATLPGVDAADLLGAPQVGAQHGPNTPWGVGLLTVSGGYEGWRTVDLALFDAPNGSQWGWFTRGRGYEARTNTAARERPDVLVRSGAGAASLIVTSTTPDGWARVQWGAASDLRGGVAWTHPALARGASVRIVTWDRLLDGAPGLVFRNQDAAHNMRAGPGADQPIVRTLDGRGFDLTIERIQGDWAQVQVHEPPRCARDTADAAGLLGGADSLAGGLAGGPGAAGAPAASLARQGWVRWRSPAKGPWLREPLGGCGARTS